MKAIGAWLAETTRHAVRGWLVFSAFFLGFTALYGASTGGLDSFGLRTKVLGLAGLAAVCFVAAWVNVALRVLGERGLGYHARWVISGMVGGVLFMGAPALWLPPYEPFDPLLWTGFWALIGGVGAYAYGRMAQDWNR